MNPIYSLFFEKSAVLSGKIGRNAAFRDLHHRIMATKYQRETKPSSAPLFHSQGCALKCSAISLTNQSIIKSTEMARSVAMTKAACKKKGIEYSESMMAERNADLREISNRIAKFYIQK